VSAKASIVGSGQCSRLLLAAGLHGAIEAGFDRELPEGQAQTTEWPVEVIELLAESDCPGFENNALAVLCLDPGLYQCLLCYNRTEVAGYEERGKGSPFHSDVLRLGLRFVRFLLVAYLGQGLCRAMRLARVLPRRFVDSRVSHIRSWYTVTVRPDGSPM